MGCLGRCMRPRKQSRGIQHEEHPPAGTGYALRETLAQPPPWGGSPLTGNKADDLHRKTDGGRAVGPRGFLP